MAVKIGETAMGRGQRYKCCVRLQHSVGELAVFRTEGSHERRDGMTLEESSKTAVVDRSENGRTPMVARHSTTRNHGVGERGNEGRSAAVGEASEED